MLIFLSVIMQYILSFSSLISVVFVTSSLNFLINPVPLKLLNTSNTLKKWMLENNRLDYLIDLQGLEWLQKQLVLEKKDDSIIRN